MNIHTTAAIVFGILAATSIAASVQVQNRYSLGDKFTYAENKTITTIELLTEKKTAKQEETIYTLRVVELEDKKNNISAEVEKIYTMVRFTPTDQRAERRLLSTRSREEFNELVNPSSEWSVGSRSINKVVDGIVRQYLVTRIYESEEYNTEVITFDVETTGSLEFLGYNSMLHRLETKEIDVETGILLSQESVQKITAINDRTIGVTVQKLIKRETAHDELYKEKYIL